MSDEVAKVGDPPDERVAVAEEEPGLDRILTTPNLITLVRLASIPVFVWLLFGAFALSNAREAIREEPW